ncbi:hypothetical protein KBX53_02675 [Micromonospora sp. M51]|uniref:hypothetical protein n=1 Tax=Micromonospora sp. M51 TaxID=2824889 RepID=UPI001B389DE5|nr:hypothetical protein [Micromonospora sp. M51]MBQ1009870.1 hypothetical protein [Micromonospora sp. M51]
MKTVAFFRELGPKQTEVYVESIHSHVDAEPLPDALQFADYLRHDHALIDVMGAEIDVLGSGQHLVGGACADGWSSATTDAAQDQDLGDVSHWTQASTTIRFRVSRPGHAV